MNAYNEHLFARDVSDYGAWSKRPKIPRKLKKKIYGTRRNWRNHRKYHGHPVLSFDRLRIRCSARTHDSSPAFFIHQEA